MLIIDSAIYNDEFILNLRLKYLYDYVDIFIVIESIYNLSGKKKSNFNFEKNINKFTNYLNKIIYIKINEFPERNDEKLKFILYNNNNEYINWFTKNYIRNTVITYLKENITEKYILIVSDSNEIINKNIILKLKKIYNTLNIILYIKLEQIFYNLNYKSYDDWIKVFCINDKYINNMENDINISVIKKTYNKNDGKYDITKIEWYIKECIMKGVIFYNSIEIIKYENKLKLEYNKKDILTKLNLLLKEYNEINIEVLEIGCNEGKITLWLLNEILTKESKIICLDLFEDIKKYNNFIINLRNYNNKQVFLFITIKDYLIKKVYINKTYNIIIINNISKYDNNLLILSLCLELINKTNGKIIIIEKLENIKKIIKLLRFNKYIFFIDNNDN